MNVRYGTKRIFALLFALLVSLFAAGAAGAAEPGEPPLTVTASDTEPEPFYRGLYGEKFYDVTMNVSADQGLTRIAFEPTSWNGLSFTPDLENRRFAVTGTPASIGTQSVNVAVTTVAGDVLYGAFTIEVTDGWYDRSPIGLWDYGNTAMHYSELARYNDAAPNTGFNFGAKYDILLFSNRPPTDGDDDGDIDDGDITAVYIKDPEDGRFIEIPRLPVAAIPRESWYYVNKTRAPSPYTSAPSPKTGLDAVNPATPGATRQDGSSYGWYLYDPTSDQNANLPSTSTLVINCQPFMDGNYTIRVEYPATTREGFVAVHTQDFTLRCAGTDGGPGTAGSGGGCGAGAGSAAAGIPLLAAFALLRRRGR